MTMDGVTHDVGKWDLLIAHPPCTYLSNAATRSFSLRVSPAEKVVARWAERVKAAIFFMQFMLADVPKIAVENPVGIMNKAYRKADQVIHPYYFAESEEDTENYHTKRTCLWLKNLPPLFPTDIVTPIATWCPSGSYSKKHGQQYKGMFTTDRAKSRAKTFTGVANAMSEQWG